MKPSSPFPRFVLPPAVGSLLGLLPAYPGSVLLVQALNLNLARQLPADVCSFLLHKKLRIYVRDAHLTFDFTWTGQRFSACPRLQATDLAISANAHDFMRLAQRREDPDTLFFSRRLAMEGDTELGLVVKNALDALELPALDLQQWTPLKVLARFGPRKRTAGIGPREHGRERT
ncbi:MAG TPA: SCP2 sterol-binding domain-containing protein [Polaromonas sp.]|uniref:ubiquinone anaerobic biosynthesis accessory factor UbiT n=1 Tax=Polaromonas sp. TaxID=1869339 RepID=UPI002D6F4CD5|nr:SCP2 sterol-binding domain-containing protein [Polaromonas sp.]HYW58168.1 SCP2 sterol-binding domain-containing protein [Polaromonas sp.]